MRTHLIVSLLVSPLLLVGCSTTDDAVGGVCEPGETQHCFCAGGGEGAQVCGGDGSGWGACDCGLGDDDVGGDDDDATLADGDDTAGDDDDTGLTDCLYYRDADEDGYGDPAEEMLESCDGPPDGYVDNDEDCDDVDGDVHPGAEELCDGLDNDCDGVEDEDLPLYECHTDEDGDGHGDPYGPVSMQCDCGPGSSPDGSDCDDGDPDVHPGAVEVCNGIDDDCSGVIPPWDTDQDGDGWSECQGDCDETNADVFPGAVEVCNDQDDDCDGILPPDETDGDADGWTPCDGECDDSEPSINPGEPEDCSNGIDDDCDGLIDGDDPGCVVGVCGVGFECLDLTSIAVTDHSDGPWTNDPSESFDVSPGTQSWLVFDGVSVPFVIIDPDTNGGRSLVCSKGGETWRPSYIFPEFFELPVGGVGGSRVHLAGMASGWSDPSLFAGIAATLTIEFDNGQVQVIDLENGENMDDWNHTWHSVASPQAVKVYTDYTYGRHIDSYTEDLVTSANIDRIVIRDDATVHTGSATKTSIALFAITVEL